MQSRRTGTMRKRVSRQPKTRSPSAPAPSSGTSVVSPNDARHADRSACLPSAATEWTCQRSNGRGRSARSAGGRVRRTSRKRRVPPEPRDPSRGRVHYSDCALRGWSGHRMKTESYWPTASQRLKASEAERALRIRSTCERVPTNTEMHSASENANCVEIV